MTKETYREARGGEEPDATFTGPGGQEVRMKKVTPPVRVGNRDTLRALARTLGVRAGWHGPDEQGLTAKVHGSQLDNAGFWGHGPGGGLRTSGDKDSPEQEMWVELLKDGDPAAEVNLATLLAWACEPEQKAPAPELGEEWQRRDIPVIERGSELVILTGGPGDPGAQRRHRVLVTHVEEGLITVTPAPVVAGGLAPLPGSEAANYLGTPEPQVTPPEQVAASGLEPGGSCRG